MFKSNREQTDPSVGSLGDPRVATINPVTLRSLLAQRAWTQATLLKRSGISRSALTRGLRRFPMAIDAVRALADTFGVAHSALIEQPIYKEKPIRQTAMYEAMRNALIEVQPRLIRVTSFQKPNPIGCGNPEMLAYHRALTSYLREGKGRLERIVAVQTIDKLFWLGPMLEEFAQAPVDAEVRVLDTPLELGERTVALPPICHFFGPRLFLANAHAIMPESDRCLNSESPALRGFLNGYFEDLWRSCERNTVFNRDGVLEANLARIVFARALDVIRYCNTPGHQPQDILQALQPIGVAFPHWFDGGFRSARDFPYGRNVLHFDTHAPFDVMLAYWNDDGRPCYPHDHGGTEGIVTLLRGEAEVTEYALRDGRLGEITQRFHLCEGAIDTISRDVVHSMQPLKKGTVTLHVYRQPMDSMNVFDPADGRPRRVFASAGAWL